MTEHERRRYQHNPTLDTGYWSNPIRRKPRKTSPLVYILILITLAYFFTPFLLNFTTHEAVKWGQGHFLTVLSEWDMRVHDKGRIVIVGMDGRRTVFSTNSDTNITLEGLFPDENENSTATD